MRTIDLLSMTIIVALVGCGPRVAMLAISPKSLMLTSSRDTAKLIVTPIDKDGKAIENVVLNYSSSDPTVVTVHNGLVTALKTGDANISVDFRNKVFSEVPVRVSIPSSIALDFKEKGKQSTAKSQCRLTGKDNPPLECRLYFGESVIIRTRVFDEKGRKVPMNVTWETLDSDMIVVDNGEIRGAYKGKWGIGEVIAIAGDERKCVDLWVNLPETSSYEVEKIPDLKVGDPPKKINVIARTDDGRIVPHEYLAFKSKDVEVVRVDSKGYLTAVAKGKTKVHIYTRGLNLPSTARIDVTVKANKSKSDE